MSRSVSRFPHGRVILPEQNYDKTCVVTVIGHDGITGSKLRHKDINHVLLRVINNLHIRVDFNFPSCGDVFDLSSNPDLFNLVMWTLLPHRRPGGGRVHPFNVNINKNDWHAVTCKLLVIT